MRRVLLLLGFALGVTLLTALFSGVSPDAQPVPSVILVSASRMLDSRDRPTDLVSLYGREALAAHLARDDIRLSAPACEAACALFQAAEGAGIDGLVITEGYRSREQQKLLWMEAGDGAADRPGASEHETGLAMDLACESGQPFETTEQYAWLVERAWAYGFVLRYPKGKERVTGVGFRPTHFRYVGRPLAERMRASGWTLEEAMALQK